MEAAGGFLGSALQDADYSIAWGVQAGDYLAQSKEFLAADIPDEEERVNAFSKLNNRFQLNDHIISAARYANWIDANMLLN